MLGRLTGLVDEPGAGRFRPLGITDFEWRDLRALDHIEQFLKTVMLPDVKKQIG